MRRWMLVFLGGTLLACSGVMTDLAPADADGDDDDAGDEEDAADAKDPLPDVAPDEDERDGDCMPESYEEADRMLTADQSKGGEVEVDASPNRIVETVVMKNGLMVRVERGGCAHAGETWTISPAPKGPVVKTMKKVLSFLDTEEDPAIEMCLDEAPDPPPQNGWAAGDANCSYTKEGKVLSFTYDFAL